MSALKRLKALDAFPKIQDDFYSKTISGGVITIVCSVVMGCLFLSELGVSHLHATESRWVRTICSTMPCQVPS
jgi:endoplasmic reticulum-Golgi intermediate compartment protein 3